MSKTKILLIEDEKKICRFLQLELEYEGYEVSMSQNGKEGLDIALNSDFDLIVLDLMLPGLNGLEVCRKLKQVKDVPIIMLTAKDEVMDKVIGLDLGADDYMTKPFAIEELLARIRVVLKRQLKTQPVSNQNILTCGKLSLDINKHILSYEDNTIDLTKKEFDFLKYLMENKNIVLTRNQILEKVWGYDFIGDTNIVDVYIRYLRSKIDEPYKQKLITTVRGVGYLFKDEES